MLSFNEFLNEEYTVHQHKKWTEEGDSDNYEPDVTRTKYHIKKNGKNVGELEHDDYFGYIRGHLHNKHLPELSNYHRDPKKAIGSFLKSKTGKKWNSNIDKYAKLKRPTNDYRIKQ